MFIFLIVCAVVSVRVVVNILVYETSTQAEDKATSDHRFITFSVVVIHIDNFVH